MSQIPQPEQLADEKAYQKIVYELRELTTYIDQSNGSFFVSISVFEVML